MQNVSQGQPKLTNALLFSSSLYIKEISPLSVIDYKHIIFFLFSHDDFFEFNFCRYEVLMLIIQLSM